MSVPEKQASDTYLGQILRALQIESGDDPPLTGGPLAWLQTACGLQSTIHSFCGVWLGLRTTNYEPRTTNRIYRRDVLTR
jgi:hypothetical protein